MSTHKGWATVLILAALLVGGAFLAKDSLARAGGGRSSGSSGSRSYSTPARPAAVPGQAASQAPAQPGGSGFLRTMGGGMLGGLFGGFLFSTLFGGAAGGFGGGIGMLEILLLGAVGYFIYTAATRWRSTAGEAVRQPAIPAPGASAASQEDGTGQTRRVDLLFHEGHFKAAALDIFFRVQAAWTGRDLSAGRGLVTEEMNGILQGDIDKLVQEKKVNRLENIAVTNVEILDAWQDAGKDFIRTLFSASLLDYTTDDATGAVVSGSRTVPVTFAEHWTFTRSGRSDPWKLSAISQP